MKTRSLQRGSALLTVVAVTSILLLLVLGVLAYSASSRRRSIGVGRGLIEQSCAAAGLQLARAHFAQNYNLWGTFLSAPGTFNPIGWSPNVDNRSIPYPAANATAADRLNAQSLRISNPALFRDIDNDGIQDVYLYCRDNDDERPPALNNWQVDSDQTIIVGAMCINNNLRARRADGTVDDDPQTAEALLKWERPVRGGGGMGSEINPATGLPLTNASPGLSNATGGAGASGTGNANP